MHNRLARRFAVVDANVESRRRVSSGKIAMAPFQKPEESRLLLCRCLEERAHMAVGYHERMAGRDRVGISEGDAALRPADDSFWRYIAERAAHSAQRADKLRGKHDVALFLRR